MFKIEKIPREDGKGFTIATIAGNVEGVNPISYYRELFIESNKVKLLEMLKLRKPPFPTEMLEPVIQKDVEKDWDEYYTRIMLEDVPPFLFSALRADNKKYQEKFLRGLSFTTEQLLSFFFKACSDLGYTLSIYSSEHLPNGTDLKDMPVLAHVDGENVIKVGETNLTNGQIKQAIEQRSAIYGKAMSGIVFS
jgi:hypothetical protein